MDGVNGSKKVGYITISTISSQSSCFLFRQCFLCRISVKDIKENVLTIIHS